MATFGLASRQPCASASNASASPISSRAAGRSRPENAPVDLLQSGDLRVDAGAIFGEPGRVCARRGRPARQCANAGAHSEQKGADLVMQVAGDVFALFVLHMDHAPHEPAIFFVEPLQRCRQRVDSFGDDDEFRRAVGGNAHRMFAALQTLQALRERRDRTQRSRHGERNEREGGDGDSRAADREPDDLLPNLGDLIRGIGSDHDRGPAAGFDSGHGGVRQHEPGEPLRRAVDVLPRGRLLSGERDANMAQPSRVGEKSRDLRLRVWRRVKSR